MTGAIHSRNHLFSAGAIRFHRSSATVCGGASPSMTFDDNRAEKRKSYASSIS